MIKQLLILFFVGITSFSTAQTKGEQALVAIETSEQANLFLKNKPSKENKIFTFNEEKHKTDLAKALFKLEIGNVKSIRTERDKTFYKILEKSSKPYYRVSYIVLDGSKYTKESINQLRTALIEKHRNGSPFSFLAKQYSMDQNANRGGDTGWFTNGDVSPDFESAIISEEHSLEDVYTFDIPEKKQYYLILQSHESKDISEIKVLKIVETAR
ncbi:peptidylprolyl isomerase [uncultured Algibacter sp.]|uniref:peptidylprolyl isomerase n=1 Tax=uncultured Algibacter sp. TaxID=298659 RepID=UPI00260AAA8E|nr:peptidylprolyl isomerase [uncultured Algibacter sp.]